MAVIDVNDAYILNETGAQVDKTTGIPFKNESLTEAEAAQARANIRAGGSNPNLLDNAYFVGGGSQLGDGVFPINQRGQTSYSTGTNTTIDRWKTEASAISVDADGLTWTATGDNNQFEQITENYKLIEGETYTATIDCDILAGSARLFVGGVGYPWPTVAGSTVNVSSGITKVTFTFTRESGYTGQYKLALASVGSCTVKLRKFKLEKGTVSTLANDPPPDFGEELRKCQRYLWVHKFAAYDVVGNGYAASTTVGGFSICLPVSMRTGGNPQATYTTLPSAYGGGSAPNLSAMNLASLIGNIARYYVEFSGIPANNSICVMATTDTTITISNEL